MTDLPMHLSNSKVNTWRRCPKKYEYQYVDKLQRKQLSRPLELGSWMHDLLEHHYNGKDWRKRQQVLTKEFNAMFEELREELGDLPNDTLRLMKSYLRKYKDEDTAYSTIATELDETIELPNGVLFQFIIDRIVEDRSGDRWLWDHKNVTSFMDDDFMLLDAQLTRYFWCAEKLGYGPIKGVVFNELRTKAPTVPEMTQQGRLSKRKIDTDYYTYAMTIKKLGLDPEDYRDMLKRLKAQPDRFFRRTTLPRDRPLTQQMMRELMMSAREIRRAERKHEFPRSVSKTCTWDCEFLDLCAVQLQGGDGDPIIKHNFEKKKKRKA